MIALAFIDKIPLIVSACYNRGVMQKQNIHQVAVYVTKNRLVRILYRDTPVVTAVHRPAAQTDVSSCIDIKGGNLAFQHFLRHQFRCVTLGYSPQINGQIGIGEEHAHVRLIKHNIVDISMHRGPLEAFRIREVGLLGF